MPVTINGSDGITNASWTTATRPSNPVAGQMGYNTDLNNLEFYEVNSDRWRPIILFSLSATGGSVSDILIDGALYRIHEFASNGTFEVVDGFGEVEYLVVAGGGGSGADYSGSTSSGGGGGGGLVNNAEFLNPGNYSIIVGAGGAAGTGGSTSLQNGQRGEDSEAFGDTAFGGGGGIRGDIGNSAPTYSTYGGGGGGSEGDGAPATSQGNAGGKGHGNGFDGGSDGVRAGGGGMGTFDTGAGGNGGDGVDFSSIFGTSFGENGYFSGGGGGGTGSFSTGQSSGGLGGGGDGNAGENNRGSAPMPNTGGGGGGVSGDTFDGVSGANGIVLIRYRIG